MHDQNGPARIALILRQIAEHNRKGLRQVDVVNLTALDKATVHRVLKALAASGFLATGKDRKRFHLGPLIYELASVTSTPFDLRSICEPFLQSLVRQTDNTVMMSVRDGLDCLCLRRVSGDYPVQVVTVEEGARRPLGVGGGTQVILAALPEAEWRTIVTKNLDRCAERGLSETAVVAAIERIREAGYASQRTATTEAAWTISVALMSSSGRPVASLSVVGITERMTGEREPAILQALQNAKREIEESLSA
ncbi:IclR family transcriptional regulator [Bordetella ansorpii]|uniref:IclR family transcriptional regulator n=1 Tax=Bordetella ansorpii TaxID=288768 RepID=A0A157SIN0_9BORD|nr:IclR family transcriptional regulator [Bordetella ansorpii]SAI70265.1 IclR family transcriptional regulator [Bordetella ansorpii]